MRRSAALVALVCGLVLIAAPLVYSMFDRTDKAERILDRFTFLTLGDNPDRYLAEAEITREGSAELVEEAIPALAADAGIREAELAERHAALAALQAELPAASDGVAVRVGIEGPVLVIPDVDRPLLGTKSRADRRRSPGGPDPPVVSTDTHKKEAASQSTPI